MLYMSFYYKYFIDGHCGCLCNMWQRADSAVALWVSGRFQDYNCLVQIVGG